MDENEIPETDIPENDQSELTQFVTTLVSIICALISLAAYRLHKTWRKHNYLYAKQIVLKAAATCCMLLIILLPEDLVPREVLVIAYIFIVIVTVVVTFHTVALGHLHVALKCEKIPDEETFVSKSVCYMTAVTGIVLLTVGQILKLEFETAETFGGIFAAAVTTGNVMFLSRVFGNIEKKCRTIVTFIFCVISLGIFCDVLLVLYGSLLLNGDSAGIFHDILKVTITGTIVLKTILILCSKDAMDWQNCRSRSNDEIEM